MTAGARRWIGVGVVGLWLLAMGLLARRELAVRSLDAGVVTVPQERTVSRMGIYVDSEAGDRRVGTVQVTRAPEERRGLVGQNMALDAEMKLNLLGKRTDLDLSGFIWRPADRKRAEFEFSIRSAEYDFKIAGGLEGQELSAEVTSAGEVFPLKFPVRGDVLFSGGFGSAFDFPLLEVGETYRLESFDPLTLRRSPARVECVAREVLEIEGDLVPTRRLRVTTSGFRSLAWIDDRGDVVRAETPVGLILQRLPGQGSAEVLAPEPSSADVADFLGRTAIRPTGLQPFRGARSMTVRLAGLDDGDLPKAGLPEDGVQVAAGGDRYRLTAPTVPGSGLPPGGLAGSEPPGPAALAADAFVQSDHPEIRRRAAEIAGEETDPWRRALRLHDWVYTRLDKEPVVSIPSALEVLRKRRGDCNEHTVLFAALARAAGVPTRIAIGVVWSDELAGFYYHAWPEVYLDGRWVWMDPTLDQPLADATHLKLLNGGIESWSRLLPFLGRLEIEVLEIE